MVALSHSRDVETSLRPAWSVIDLPLVGDARHVFDEEKAISFYLI
jgi:hypothetical protein